MELRRKLELLHAITPGLRKLPIDALAIVSLLCAVNAVVWAVAGIVFHYNEGLASTGTLAYTLGLRHALDADHISAIDLMTRRLVADGRRPVTVGTYFSLGHSTIVIVTCIVVAATANAISSRFDAFSVIGGIIGTSVSAGVLILLGIINVWVMYKLVKHMRKLLRHRADETASGQRLQFQGTGCMFWIFKSLLRIVDRPWKMYPVGVLFGLGFDTSSEVALLGIASIEGAKGTSIWLMLIFPALFTAGMCLLDTVDGALMLSLYASTEAAQDEVAITYYSIALTAITVIVAIVIGTIQVLSLVVNTAAPEGPFWDGVQAAGDHFDIIGGCICASFIVFGGLSFILYTPWRRYIEAEHLGPSQQISGEGRSQNVVPEETKRSIPLEYPVRSGLNVGEVALVDIESQNIVQGPERRVH